MTTAPNITQQLTTPDSNKVKPYVARANGGGLGTSVNINLKPNYQINGKQRWFGEIDPVFTQFVQLEKTAYTLASPLVVGGISAGNNLYIKSNQLVNDKSVISAHHDSYLHSKHITAINQKLGEKSVWVSLQNALDEPTNYLLLQGFLHQLWGWIPAHHAYEHNYYDDVRIRYFIDHDQYLSFIPADKAPDALSTFNSVNALIPINQPEIWLWRDNDFLSSRFSAGNNLVITADKIESNKIYPLALNSVRELHEKYDYEPLLAGRNITLTRVSHRHIKF